MYEILTGLGLAMPAGLNAYIPLLGIAVADRYFGLIQLNAPYDMISSPWGITILTILLVIEVLADKIPLIDHVNDLINSAVRPTAGAVVLMASTDAVSYINPIMAMILGLLAAGSVHSVKSMIRPTITTSTGGLGNPVVSALEDGAAVAISIAALLAPIVILGILIVLLLGIVYFFRRHRRGGARRSPAGT